MPRAGLWSSRHRLCGLLFHVAEKDREVADRRPRRHLVEEVGDEAAVIGRMVDDVQQHLAARHGAFAAADEREADALAERGVGDAVAPGHIPVVDLALLACELLERWPGLGVAR